MRLMEFFGKTINVQKENEKGRDDDNQKDDLFWFIVNHNKLHKDYFLPLATDVFKINKKGNVDKEEVLKKFQPMVEKGCMEYYKHNDLKERLEKVFPKDLRDDLCERLCDFYYEDIIKGAYKLG
jgi:hypothetical protein